MSFSGQLQIVFSPVFLPAMLHEDYHLKAMNPFHH